MLFVRLLPKVPQLGEVPYANGEQIHCDVTRAYTQRVWYSGVFCVCGKRVH